MNTSLDHNTLTIYIEGKITSANAADMERDMTLAREQNPHDAVILDLEKMPYISSAGLRVILRMRRSEVKLSLINACPEVYNILDMTGFSEMIPVSKAFRQMSVEGCKIIGEGSNGIVYRYSDEIIIKVYKNKDALEEIKKERELAKTALVLGINTAISYDVVKIGDSYGAVFELLNAKSISDLITEDPEHFDDYIKIFVDTLKEIHSIAATSDIFPSIKEKYLNYVYFLEDHLADDDYEALLHLVTSIPESDHIVHGDYHTNNIHYSNNEAFLIDMDTLGTGNPLFEFASIFLSFVGFNTLNPGSSLKYLSLDKDTCIKIYDKVLKLYFSGEAERIHSYDTVAQILGFTRLLRRTIRRHPDHTDQICMLKEKICSMLKLIPQSENR